MNPAALVPAISIVIPMYNSEKYIGALLKSILGQTFKDFEIIVVDDCSTDNSAKIVESFIPKFGGQLKLSRMQKNSGNPSAPSNKGVSLSRGKYVYIVDNDDLLVNNTLEILYNYAEKFEVDVIHMDNYWEFIADDNKIFPSQQDLKLYSPRHAVKQPTLMIEDKSERLKKVCGGFYTWPAWHKFVKRDFLIENNITFLDLKSSSDVGWTVQVVYYAEKLLRISEPLYVYRIHSKSLTAKKRTPENEINFWADMFINGIIFFDDWANKQKFFQDNPQFKWMILDLIATDYAGHMSRTVFLINRTEYFKLIESKLKETFGENASVMTYCFASLLLSKLQIWELSQNLNKLNNTVKTLQANQNKGG